MHLDKWYGHTHIHTHTHTKCFIQQVCLSSGIFFTALSTLMLPFIVIKPHKFAVSYSLGNLLMMGSTFFLVGPKRQMQNMFQGVCFCSTFVCMHYTCMYMPLVGSKRQTQNSSKVFQVCLFLYERVYAFNLLMMGGTFFLVGPKRQMQNMFQGMFFCSIFVCMHAFVGKLSHIHTFIHSHIHTYISSGHRVMASAAYIELHTFIHTCTHHWRT
jgi:hypothetical protein